MGMFSEIASENATRHTVQLLCQQIAKELKVYAAAHDVGAVRALKAIGRFALTRLEWDSPTWTAKYEKMFRE